jgi:hypothetical protein
MRILFGIIGVIAAMVFVSYAAVTSYHTAFSMTTQFQQLAGAAAAAMVAWEAIGALFVMQCWRNGSKLMAFGGAALVLAASVYLIRLDLRFHVAGQSDLTAAREVGIENRETARSEYEKAVSRRDSLRKLKTPDIYEKRELANADKRIADLEPKLWGTEMITAGGMPEASWASRMLGGVSTDRQWWTDVFMVLGILFWALARMLALPVAVASMQMTRKRDELKERWRDLEEAEAFWKASEASGRAEAPGAIVVAPQPVPAFPAPSVEATLPMALPALAEHGSGGLRALKLQDDEPRDPPPSGGKKIEEAKTEAPAKEPVIQPSEEVGQQGKTAAFFDEEEDRDPPVIDYDTKLRLTKKEQRKRKLAMVAAKKKLSTRAADEEQIYVDVETWASLLRKGRPEDQITSKDCRVNIQDYAEMHGYHMPDKKVLSAQISAVIDKLNGVKHEKGKRRPRTNKGVVWHGWYLLDASCLLNMSPERARA